MSCNPTYPYVVSCEPGVQENLQAIIIDNRTGKIYGNDGYRIGYIVSIEDRKINMRNSQDVSDRVPSDIAKLKSKPI